MSSADVRVIAIALFFIAIYGIFMLSFSKESNTAGDYSLPNASTSGWEGTGAFGAISSFFSLSTPSGTANMVVFGVFSALLIFIALRFVRGQA